MNININDKVTLSNDRKYVVISKIEHEGVIYYYLVDEDSKTDIKICFENVANQSLIQIKNPEMIAELFPIFLKKSQEYIADLIVNSEI